MAIHNMSSRQFNQDTGGAKKAANSGPVFITDRGVPSHVLISIEEYNRLTGNQISLLKVLVHESSRDIDFSPPKLKGPELQNADLNE